MMAEVVHGPYEHVGAYADLAESEVFDTSGTPDDFCPSCEHAPCVAGAKEYCDEKPRFIVVTAIHREIIYDYGYSQHMLPLMRASRALMNTAVWDDRATARETALAFLVQMRTDLRKGAQS